MSISGHKTISMFRRYDIISGADHLDAEKKVGSYLAEQPATPAAVVELAAARAKEAS